MPYEAKPINQRRVENTSTIDMMCGIELIGDNKHRYIPAHIEIPQPYIKHDANKGKSYFVGKKGVVKHKLCDVIVNALNGTDNPDSFKDAVCIEFCMEDDKDTTPKTRAMEFYAKVHAALAVRDDFPVKFSMESWPASNMNDYKNYPHSEYIIFKPDIEKGMTRLKIKIQK
jgi:hypothetical protein